jgi:hypothetical protein
MAVDKAAKIAARAFALSLFLFKFKYSKFYLWCEKLMKGNSTLIKNSLPQGQGV